MSLETEVVVNIPDQHVKFFDGTGKMFLPSMNTLEKIMKDIPPGRLVTTNIICRSLIKEFGVRGTCPVTTKRRSLHWRKMAKGKRLALSLV